jgi:hypothetical protein
VEADLPVGLAPDQPDRQAGAQLATGGLVADAAVQAGPQHVQLSLAEHALHAQLSDLDRLLGSRVAGHDVDDASLTWRGAAVVL